MPCKMSCTSSRLSSPLSLCGLLGFVQVVLSQHGHRAANSRLSRCSCSSSDSTKLLLLLNPVLRHCVQYTSSVALTVFRRLLLCPINHHLVDWRDFPQYLRHHCERFGLSTGNNALSSSSACSVIALASALASSRATQPLQMLALLLGPLGPLRAFRAYVASVRSSSRPSSSGLIWLEAVSMIASSCSQFLTRSANRCSLSISASLSNTIPSSSSQPVT